MSAPLFRSRLEQVLKERARSAVWRSAEMLPHEGNHIGLRTGIRKSYIFPQAKLKVYPEIWFKSFGHFG